MTPPAWCRDYVGIPFAEHGRGRTACDCWGLVALVLQDQFGVYVPSYAADYASPMDREEVAQLITGETPKEWRWTRPEEAQPGDAVLFRVMGRPIHVGILVAPPWFLHVMQGIDAALERLDSPAWEKRILGIYRHGRLAPR